MRNRRVARSPVAEPGNTDKLRVDIPARFVKLRVEMTCDFSTTTPKGAMSQSARGGATRYRRCKNPATRTIIYTQTSLAHTTERTAHCCTLHWRKHHELGWLP